MKGIIIVFRLPKKTENKELSKFCQRFYGQDSSSHKGKYRYHRHGLLDDIPHRKLLRGVIVIRAEDRDKILEFLGQYSVEIHTRQVKLTEEDCRILGLSIE